MIPARGCTSTRAQNARPRRRATTIGLVQTDARLPTWVHLAADAEL